MDLERDVVVCLVLRLSLFFSWSDGCLATDRRSGSGEERKGAGKARERRKVREGCTCCGPQWRVQETDFLGFDGDASSSWSPPECRVKGGHWPSFLQMSERDIGAVVEEFGRDCCWCCLGFACGSAGHS